MDYSLHDNNLFLCSFTMFCRISCYMLNLWLRGPGLQVFSSNTTKQQWRQTCSLMQLPPVVPDILDEDWDRQYVAWILGLAVGRAFGL